MPITSVSRAGVFSITSSVSVPNFSTIRFASDGPMPGNAFEPRNFSMPALVFGVSELVLLDLELAAVLLVDLPGPGEAKWHALVDAHRACRRP